MYTVQAAISPVAISFLGSRGQIGRRSNQLLGHSNTNFVSYMVSFEPPKRFRVIPSTRNGQTAPSCLVSWVKRKELGVVWMLFKRGP
jgi:hypothetical protein